MDSRATTRPRDRTAPHSRRRRTGGSGGQHLGELDREVEVERELALALEQQLHRPEVLAVEGRDALLEQCLAVIDRRVAAVVLPAVAGILERELRHEPV